MVAGDPLTIMSLQSSAGIVRVCQILVIKDLSAEKLDGQQ